MEFAEVHIAATAREFDLDCKTFSRYNQDKLSHRAWHLATFSLSANEDTHIMAIDLAEHAKGYLPPIGHHLGLQLYDPTNKKALSVMWEAEHVPFTGDITQDGSVPSELVFMKLNLAAPEVQDGGVISNPLLPRGTDLSELAGVTLTALNAISVCLHFRVSNATSQAELMAIYKLMRGEGITSRQVAALNYIVKFDEPATTVNLFEKFPHMEHPHSNSQKIPPYILAKYDRLNEHQKCAYAGLLGKLPCGIGILPGGPGGGKTHFAMTTVGLLQSGTNAKVLYLLDINKPLEDTLRKYLAMWKAAGVKKTAIRVKNFGAELKNSNRFEEIREASKAAAGIDDLGDAEPVTDFSKQFMRYFQNPSSRPKDDSINSECPSLDEAAWLEYEARPKTYERLKAALQESSGDPMDTGMLRFLIFFLYRSVLRQADFIATTPCVASGRFSTMFHPDMVVLDEAAHARELTSLIPIAFFKNCVWLFIGDFRQTLPFVKHQQMNNRAPQLMVSTMERAHNAGVIHHQLLINHRAFGNLHRLASRMIYNNQMVSGIPEDQRFPETLETVRDFFQKVMRGDQCVVPRLIVQIESSIRPKKNGTSWASVAHTRWTVSRVMELLANPKFVNVDDPTKPGTILLLSPYKASVEKYKEAIEVMERIMPTAGWKKRVESRTWDVSQGHEADVVGIDYVRDRPTPFMDGQHRFNVGLTRARQGEWHILPRRMVYNENFRKTRYLQKLYHACLSGQEGHIVAINYH